MSQVIIAENFFLFLLGVEKFITISYHLNGILLYQILYFLAKQKLINFYSFSENYQVTYAYSSAYSANQEGGFSPSGGSGSFRRYSRPAQCRGGFQELRRLWFSKSSFNFCPGRRI